MKTAKLLLLLTLFLRAEIAFNQELKVISYNIRYNNPADGLNRWDLRKDEMLGFLKNQNAEIIGLQEVLHSQKVILEKNLGDYFVIGNARDDGKQAGEYAPLLVHKKKFKLLESGTFWLSPTPDTPSRGWDAALNRICTWAKLEVTTTKTVIYVFNTHFDHYGRAAREQAANLMLQQINQKLAGKSYPVILMGDLNAEPQEPPVAILNHQLKDASLGEKDTLGLGTFNNFESYKHDLKQIDYIFFLNLKKKHFEVLRPLRKNQLQLSDHYAIGATFYY
jgi:endonuclease/exonuclease/phosphatase family metal-dependent hydrolase